MSPNDSFRPALSLSSEQVTAFLSLVHGFPQGQCRLAEPVLVDRWRRTQAQVARGVELLGPGDVAGSQGQESRHLFA